MKKMTSKVQSEMYLLGVMHGQQKMRKKMLSQLDQLLEVMRYGGNVYDD